MIVGVDGAGKECAAICLGRIPESKIDMGIHREVTLPIFKKDISVMLNN